MAVCAHIIRCRVIHFQPQLPQPHILSHATGVHLQQGIFLVPVVCDRFSALLPYSIVIHLEQLLTNITFPTLNLWVDTLPKLELLLTGQDWSSLLFGIVLQLPGLHTLKGSRPM